MVHTWDTSSMGLSSFSIRSAFFLCAAWLKSQGLLVSSSVVRSRAHAGFKPMAPAAAVSLGREHTSAQSLDHCDAAHSAGLLPSADNLWSVHSSSLKILFTSADARTRCNSSLGTLSAGNVCADGSPTGVLSARSRRLGSTRTSSLRRRLNSIILVVI